eukprot:TRINITY_DN10007_c0_g1_i1.p1 TRINITY_DN10007_c0_g1~~TRINITY_DN10007_c0_g1_i1.p1  ORF type:complete len:312 (+),score=42.31 TRINITY_DN10007_c0_g1_i1:381-1316(+)
MEILNMSHVLNFDVMHYVLQHLQDSYSDLASALLVCHEWYDAASYDDLWKNAFMVRWPLIGRLTAPNIKSWRHHVVAQMRRERGIASILSNKNETHKSNLPGNVEYTGTAAGAPAAPLSDSFRLGCILENDESQKIFRDFSALFPGVQIITQTGKQESYSQKNDDWLSPRRAYLPAICWVARAGRAVDSEEGYWQIRRSLDLSGWIFKFIDRRRPAAAAGEIDLAVYELEKTIGPWVRKSSSIRSVDFDDQSKNRTSFANFSQWLYAVEQGISVEHFALVLDDEKATGAVQKQAQAPVALPPPGQVVPPAN